MFLQFSVFPKFSQWPTNDQNERGGRNIRDEISTKDHDDGSQVIWYWDNSGKFNNAKYIHTYTHTHTENKKKVGSSKVTLACLVTSRFNVEDK